MMGIVQMGRCAGVLIQHRDGNKGSSGGFDRDGCKAKDYRPSSAIATGSFGAVSPPLSG
jgi:hypothetical protein